MTYSEREKLVWVIESEKVKKVKSVYDPSGQPGQSLPRFLQYESTRHISTATWMRC